MFYVANCKRLPGRVVVLIAGKPLRTKIGINQLECRSHATAAEGNCVYLIHTLVTIVVLF